MYTLPEFSSQILPCGLLALLWPVGEGYFRAYDELAHFIPFLIDNS